MENDDRITFELTLARLWEARFVSHLDLMRGIARGMRRSGLPIYFSEGFNPKPKISYCTQPLSVGHTSQCERIQIHLHEEKCAGMGTKEVSVALADSMMPGLKILNISKVLPGEKKKGQGESYDYVCFKRTGGGISKPETKADSREEPINVDATRVLEKMTWKVLDFSEAVEGILANNDQDGGSAFIRDNFNAAVLITIKIGEHWVRPDEAAMAIPEFLEPGDAHYLHRKNENPKNT